MHIINRINYYLKRNKIASLGKDAIFSGDIKLINPKYITIGSKCRIGPNCKLEAWDKYQGEKFNPTIKLGNDVRINSNCHVGAINKIVIGDNTLIGSNVLIIDHSHGRNTFKEAKIHPSERQLYSKGPIVIGKYCWICENVCILPDVHVGECSVIGANAVVTKDIPPYSVAVGNPAKVVKRILKDES